MKNQILTTSLVATATTFAACASAGIVSNADRVTASATPSIYVFESDANGFNTKTVFFDNGREVVAFDSQFTPGQAQQAIAFLRTKTNHPIAYLVVTHPNPDKFNAISEFKKQGAVVVASKATQNSMPEVHRYKKNFFVSAGMFTNENYPQLGQIDRTFDRSLTLELKGGDRIELSELSRPGVSTNQTIALIPSAHALIVGDLVHHGVHAWLEGGISGGKATPTLEGWAADLLELKARFAGQGLTVYGGRGSEALLEPAVDEQIRYLKHADEIVRTYIAQLGARRIELTNEKAQGHYAQLQKVFETEFPGYGLGYLIQYGVYGLVNARL
jgi:glyoxylase-like metal-dependent hydrolase (beta-lactamase superfamily II)